MVCPLVAATALLAIVGCCGPGGPPLGKVSGTVTLDGQPLSGARVDFQPEDPAGSPSHGETDASGKYTLQYGVNRPGAMVGKHNVRISKGGYIIDENEVETFLEEQVPASYNTESTVFRDVERGSNTFDFDIKTDGQE